tara:strand:- start:1457 stop:1762 length:306 start_codon:yes stop_codon:yes gene_type:complete
MKKFTIILLIFSLILLTAIIKNSTKRIDDEIFVKKENIRILEKDMENIKLEYEYLSSAEKLLEFQNLFFENELFIQKISKIKVINKTEKKLEINQFKIFKD